MPNITGTTRAQTIFLRALIKGPAALGPEDWPRPSMLRRWLRRPAFRRALDSLRDTLIFQADFVLSAAAAAASTSLFPSSSRLAPFVIDKDTFHHLRAILGLADRRHRSHLHAARVAALTQHDDEEDDEEENIDDERTDN